MQIEAIKIDGIDYDIVEVERPFNCAECDFYDFEEAACKLENEFFGWVCPAAILCRRIALKKRKSKLKRRKSK